MKKLKGAAFIFGVLTMSFLAAYLAFAQVWQEPTQPPPGGNVDAPLNVSADSQRKTGVLRIGGLRTDSHTFLATEGGRVGIGTIGPRSALDISYAQDTAPFTAPLAFSPSGRSQIFLLTWWNAGNMPAGSLMAASNFNSSGHPFHLYYRSGKYPYPVRLDIWSNKKPYTESDIYYNTGRVGIGTDEPSQQLDVIGYVRGSQGLCIGDDCRNSWPEGGTGNGASLPAGVKGQTLRHSGTGWVANSLLFHDIDNSRIGIGTALPKQQLHVAGNAYIDNNLNVGIEEEHTFVRLHIKGEGRLPFKIEPSPSFGIADLSRLAAAGPGAFFVGPKYGESSPPVYLYFRESEFINVLNAWKTSRDLATTSFAGSVMIGSANEPSQKLDVIGYVRGSQGLCIGDDCRNSWPEGGTGNGASLPAGVKGQTLRHSGTGWAANSLLFHDTDNARIGIGITNPVAKLHVVGDAIVGGPSAIIWSRPEPAGSLGKLYLGTTNNLAAVIGRRDQLNYYFYDGASWRLPMSLSTDFSFLGLDSSHHLNLGGGMSVAGNVGIGTNSPAQKLDVIGYVRGSQGLCIGDDCRNSWPEGGTGNGASLPAGVKGQTLRHSGTGWVANSLLFHDIDNDRIGIGIASPEKNLHVTGEILLDTSGLNKSITIRRSSVHAQSRIIFQEKNNIDKWSVGMDGGLPNNAFRIAEEGSLRLAVLQGGNVGIRRSLSIGESYWTFFAPVNGAIIEGNVGIGKNNPKYNLDVKGDIVATNIIWSRPEVVGNSGALYLGTDNRLFAMAGRNNQLNYYFYDGSSWKLPMSLSTDFGIPHDSSHHLSLGGGMYVGGNVGIGVLSPGYKLTVAGQGHFSRDGMTECCSAGDFTLSVAERTAGSGATGRRASIQFHNANEAEGYLRLNPGPHGREILAGSFQAGMNLRATAFVRGDQGLCIGNDCRTNWPVGNNTKIQSGTANASAYACGAGKYSENTVTFPAAFSGAPAVTIAPVGTAPGGAIPVAALKSGSITNRGFTFYWSTNDFGRNCAAGQIHWIAIGI